MTYLSPMLPVLLVVVAIGLLRPSSRRFRLAAAAAVLAVFLWNWPPVAVLTAGTLEWRYPVEPMPRGDAQAIVVLSGSTFDATPEPERLPGQGTYMRCRYAAWLYKNWKKLPIVASGGPETPVAAADVMRGSLEAEGIPPADIAVERASRSTRENAGFTAALLLPRGVRTIVLVTEAFHMPRAERSFAAAGFTVRPAPCCFRTRAFENWRTLLLPNARAAVNNDEALHEWAGLLWYLVRR